MYILLQKKIISVKVKIRRLEIRRMKKTKKKERNKVTATVGHVVIHPHNS